MLKINYKLSGSELLLFGHAPNLKNYCSVCKSISKEHFGPLHCFLALGSVFRYSLFEEYLKGAQTDRSIPHAGFAAVNGQWALVIKFQQSKLT